MDNRFFSDELKQKMIKAKIIPAETHGLVAIYGLPDRDGGILADVACCQECNSGCDGGTPFIIGCPDGKKRMLAPSRGLCSRAAKLPKKGR
jgi:hypothetical protein